MDSPDDFEIGQNEGVEMKDKDANKKIMRRRIEEYKVSNTVLYLSKNYLLGQPSQVAVDLMT